MWCILFSLAHSLCRWQCVHGGYQVERGGHGQVSFGHSQGLSQHKIVLIGGLGLPMQTIECNHGKDLANEVVSASSTNLY